MTITFSIQEVAERTDIAASKLRYYEKIGLIMPIARSVGGHRAYTEDDITWIEFLKCMQKARMPLDDLRLFCQLHHQRAGLEQRLDILKAQQARVEYQRREIEQTQAFLEKKIARFEAAIMQRELANGQPDTG